MHTHFAPAKRANEKELLAEIEMVKNSPVISGLLHSVSGLLAILDEHRQILGGEVTFTSSPKEGTLFLFSLPLGRG